MKNVYLIAAILGAVIPYYYFFPFIAEFGLDLPAFGSALVVNYATAGLTADLLISSLVFWLFMFQQQKRRHGPNPWPFIVINLCIGLSCALPAYLYVRERPESRSLDNSSDP